MLITKKKRKSYQCIPTKLIEKYGLESREARLITSLASSKNNDTNNITHDRFGVKIKIPKNCYITSQERLAIANNVTRKQIRCMQERLMNDGIINVRPIYYKQRKIGSLYHLVLEQNNEPIVKQGPILLETKFMPKSYLKTHTFKYKTGYNRDMSFNQNTKLKNTQKGLSLNKDKNINIPYSHINNKRKEEFKKLDKVKSFVDFSNNVSIDIRVEFVKAAHTLKKLAPEKINLEKTLAELKEPKLDEFYSLYNLVIIRGKLIKQQQLDNNPKWYKEWDRYREGPSYSRETMEILELGMKEYIQKDIEQKQKKAIQEQKAKVEKIDSLQALKTKMTKKYWKQLQVNYPAEAEYILKKAKVMSIKINALAQMTKVNRTSKSQLMFDFACIELTLDKIDKHKDAIEKMVREQSK
jgi:hypothetical protein